MATKWCVQRKESEGLGYFGDKRKMGESETASDLSNEDDGEREREGRWAGI